MRGTFKGILHGFLKGIYKGLGFRGLEFPKIGDPNRIVGSLL